MEKNNKKRLLKIIDILRKHSNEDRHLSLNEIVSLLNEEGVEVSNRKTLYDDFKILNEEGYDIEYENGYYLLEAPFCLSEIKIIQDSINSLKNLDDNLLNNLSNKLYSFISDDEVKLLEKLKYVTSHKDKKLLQRMEDILLAIKNNVGVSVTRSNNAKEVIFPLFIYRSNDYYYFYYHYENSEKLYHYRFDNVVDIKILDIKDELNIQRKTIIDTIDASTSSFYKGKSQVVNLVVNNHSDYLDQRILDDFPNAIKTKDGYSVKVSVNNQFYSKLVSYGEQIKITDKDISDKYIEYLKGIISIYPKKK